MGNNLLVWYLVHTQHLKKPVRSEPICHGSGYARLTRTRARETRTRVKTVCKA